uniref:sister chromatid cohesion protein DCC1-like n=1 Tax=Styela clava TaxID=7725 RepID=UPI0019393D1C|nr:sister chromatid cohesion protein DCC1-like [Styela clava]
MQDTCCRSEDDVIETLKLSKLNQSDLARPSQTLYFANDSSDQSFTLIQLNKDILEHITKGETLVIRGGEDDSATLCTSDCTYDLKKARTSNTLLTLSKCTVSAKKKSSVASDSSTSEEEQENIDDKPFLLYRNIIGWSHDYLELKRIHPQLFKIKQLLGETLFQGPEKEEENVDKMKYTLTDLLNIVQASEGELTSALFNMGCICIDGYWRLLDFGYIVDCLGAICNVIDSESWDIFKVPFSQLCEKINDSGELVPGYIVHHLMAFYGTMIFMHDNSEKYFKLKEEKVCRFFAEMLLRDVGKFNLTEFLEDLL